MFDFLHLLGVDTAGFELGDHAGAISFVKLLGVVLGIVFYPALWAFLRYSKKVRVKFNVALLATTISVAMLPMLAINFFAANYLVQYGMMDTITSAEFSKLNFALVCLSDPAKVPPAAVADAKKYLSSSEVVWRSPKPGSPLITGAHWATVDNPCSYQVSPHWHTSPKAIQSAITVEDRLLFALSIDGFVLLFALASIVMDTLSLDISTIDGERYARKVPITVDETILFVGLWTFFLPYGLFIRRIFELPPFKKSWSRRRQN